jgi:hypothetical protein
MSNTKLRYQPMSSTGLPWRWILLGALCALPAPLVAQGAYCGAADRIIWTTDSGSPTPHGVAPTATFNIFAMDASGATGKQLTRDAWPVHNQHPVFTPDCRRIVWARGKPGAFALWIMDADGSAQRRLAAPPTGAEDVHPWIAGDGRIYFSRHSHTTHTHALWRMNLDGSGAAELVGDGQLDRFHPNLRNDGNLVLYTSRVAGSDQPSEIRIFDQANRRDSRFYAPAGAHVSAAIWHPAGDRIVLAEDRTGSGNYQILEVSYPGATVIKTLTDNRDNNTMPYYAYPSAGSIAWVEWPGGRRTSNIALMKSDGTGQHLLTADAHENTFLLGELDILPAISGKTGNKISSLRPHCVTKPVGCNPHPPPCGLVLLPAAIQSAAQKLGHDLAQADQQGGIKPVPPEQYTEFAREHAQGVLRQFLSSADSSARERVADLVVNAYLLAGAGLATRPEAAAQLRGATAPTPTPTPRAGRP